MNKVRYAFLFVCTIPTLLLSNIDAQAQKLTYEGFMRNKKVGELTAVREVNDENTKIHISTDIEAHMLVKIEVELKSESTYINQELVESSSISKMNGHVKSNVQTVHKNDHYQINADGDDIKISKSSMVGADIFYFEEPKNINEVYSLALGELLQVEKGEEAGVYFFEQDGKKEYHKYKNGVLAEVHIDHALYSITFKIKD